MTPSPELYHRALLEELNGRLDGIETKIGTLRPLTLRCESLGTRCEVLGSSGLQIRVPGIGVRILGFRVVRFRGVISEAAVMVGQ